MRLWSGNSFLLTSFPLFPSVPTASFRLGHGISNLARSSFLRRLRVAVRENRTLQSQQLTRAPRLERTTARCVWRICVGDFADVAEACIVQVREHWSQEFFARFLLRFPGVIADANPGFDEGTGQPRPHRPLMINTVALVNASHVVRRVSSFIRRETAKSQRRPQARFDFRDNLHRHRTREEVQRQAADGEDLIGAEASVHATGNVVAIDDIVEALAVLIPKARPECGCGLVGFVLPARQEPRADVKRVGPARSLRQAYQLAV